MFVPKKGFMLAIVSVAGMLFAAASAQAQGIAASAHDLTAGQTGAAAEICAYCHTPHAANLTVEAPLWNKNTQTLPASYTTYDSTTIDGTVLAVGSVSIACLTCHDGAQAMDSVVNAPGAGAGTGDLGAVGDAGLPMNAGIIANLGTDLTNDHPIGIQYGGFGATPIDPDFNTTDLATATINGLPRWWVNTPVGASPDRQKTDIILYTRDNTVDATGNEPFVECASCHDPHNNTNPTFLRISNTGSDLCLACHTK